MSRSVTLSMHSFNDLQNKIAAIKGVRVLKNMGLKESKDLVELVTPGHSETIVIDHDLLEPRYGDAIELIKKSGLSVQINHHNNPARKDIADQIRSIVTYATMSAQYDISRALIDVMETYCPDPSDDYNPGNENDDRA